MERSLIEGTIGIALLTTSPKYEELVYELIQHESMVLIVNKECELAKRILPGTPIVIKEAKDEIFAHRKHSPSSFIASHTGMVSM